MRDRRSTRKERRVPFYPSNLSRLSGAGFRRAGQRASGILPRLSLSPSPPLPQRL